MNGVQYNYSFCIYNLLTLFLLIQDLYHRMLLLPTFTNTLISLICCNLLLTNTNNVTFDLLIKGFIPTALTVAITSVVNKKEASSIINSVIGIVQTLFKDEIWSYRCELFN